MKDFLELILTFLTDTSKKIVHKLLFISLTILGLYLINNVFGFTYYFNTGKKIEQLKSISELLKDSTLSREERNYLLAEERYTIERENVFQRALGFFESPRDTTGRTEVANHNRVNPVPKFNKVLNYLTANVTLILLMLLFVWAGFASSTKGTAEKIGALASVILFDVILFFLGKLISGIIERYSPFDTPFYQYVVNILANIFLIVLIAWLAHKQSEKKKQNYRS